MFQIDDDMTIYVTRGDVGYFSVTADNNGKYYRFQKGDVLRIKVTKKKDCSSVVLQKDFVVTEETEQVNILLTEEETKIGDVISKPVDYWYEIELNPYTNPQTIIGYDDDGAKIFKLFPEGKDLVLNSVKEEDIPVVDTGLSLTSERPVQNRVVTGALIKITESINKKIESDSKTIASLKEEVEKESERFSIEVATGILRLNNMIESGEFYSSIAEITPNTNKGTKVADSVVIRTSICNATIEIKGLKGTFNEFLLVKIPKQFMPKNDLEEVIVSESGKELTVELYGDLVMLHGTYEGEKITVRYDLLEPNIAELADMRTRCDGKIYSTAGEAIRSQFVEILTSTLARVNSLFAIFPKLAFKEPLTDEERSNFLNAWDMELDLPHLPSLPDLPDKEEALYPLASGSHTFSDGTTLTVSNGNRVRIIFGADVLNASIVLSNMKENGSELINSNALNPQNTWFVLKQNDDIKVKYTDYRFNTSSDNIAIGFKKKGTPDSVSGLSATYPTVSIDETMIENVNIGNMFMYVTNVKAGDTLEFNVSVTVNGTKYV